MNIEGTPTIIVGGKYMMRFSSGDWNVSMNKVDEMIDAQAVPIAKNIRKPAKLHSWSHVKSGVA